ncbi:MAG: hypothetical protein E7195_09000 [Peptococcaceae bacterium]|nr:hypothetical protein [Peptococcaceae bacterium]
MNQKTKKLVACICMGAAVLTSVPAVSWADTAVVSVNEQNNEITPYMMYLEDWGNALSISNGIATVDCWVEGNVIDATKAKVIAELQVKGSGGWMPVAIWTDTQNDYRASVYETKSVTKGNTYRVKATVTVWEGSQSETQTVYSGEKTV